MPCRRAEMNLPCAHSHIEHLRWLANVHRSRPPKPELAIRELPPGLIHHAPWLEVECHQDDTLISIARVDPENQIDDRSSTAAGCQTCAPQEPARPYAKRVSLDSESVSLGPA